MFGRRGGDGGENARMATRVLLVEDEDFTRTTVAAALGAHGVEVVAAVGGAQEAVDAARSQAFDVAVLDLDLGPGPTGIDLAHGLRRARPELGIVMLTSFVDPRLLSSSLAELPSGSTYVVKQSLSSMEMLVSAIEGARLLAGTGTPDSSVTGLTQSQVETLRLLACGLSNAEIARVRVVTEKSVEQAIARAAKRLGVTAASGTNQRVALAREYFAMTGAAKRARSAR